MSQKAIKRIVETIEKLFASPITDKPIRWCSCGDEAWRHCEWFETQRMTDDCAENLCNTCYDIQGGLCHHCLAKLQREAKAQALPIPTKGDYEAGPEQLLLECHIAIKKLENENTALKKRWQDALDSRPVEAGVRA